MNNKLENIKEIFLEEGQALTIKEEEDLTNQLNRKSYVIYFKAIDFLKDNKVIINYQNVSGLIKLEKRFLRSVWSFVTSLEEQIRSYQINMNETTITWNDYKSKMSKKLIDEINVSNISSKETLHSIRKLRNATSHLNYLIMDGKASEVIRFIFSLKDEIAIVNKGGLFYTLRKIKCINSEIKFQFYDEYFVEYEKYI